MNRTGIISLGLGLTALLILVGTSAAAPIEKNQSNASFVNQNFQSWRGFATNDQESHVLRMSIESVGVINTTQIRKLLEAHAGVDEIYSQIEKEQSEVTSKGYLRLGKTITEAKSNPNGTNILEFTVGKQEIYELVNMKMSPSGNYTVIDSDVAERGYSEQNSTAKIVGHITVNAADLNPDHYAELSDGQLTMNSGLFPGKYKVLLETQSRGMLFVNQSRESSLGNMSEGINLLDQEGLLNQAYGPSMSGDQSDKQVKRVFVRRSSGNESGGITLLGTNLPGQEGLLNQAYGPLMNASQGDKQTKLIVVRRQA